MYRTQTNHATLGNLHPHAWSCHRILNSLQSIPNQEAACAMPLLDLASESAWIQENTDPRAAKSRRLAQTYPRVADYLMGWLWNGFNMCPSLKVLSHAWTTHVPRVSLFQFAAGLNASVTPKATLSMFARECMFQYFVHTEPRCGRLHLLQRRLYF